MIRVLFLWLAITTVPRGWADEPITVASSPVLSNVGIFVAFDKGYFRDLGLNIKLLEESHLGTPLASMLATGTVQVGAGNINGDLLRAISQNHQIKMVADKGHTEPKKDNSGLLIRKDLVTSGKYKNFSNLKGLRIAITNMNGVSQQMIIEKFLELEGMTKTDVKFVKIPFSEINAALKGKQIDAAVQIEPYLSLAKADDSATEVSPSSKVCPHQQSAALFFSPDFAKRHKADGINFLIAYLKGVRYYNRSLTDPVMHKEVIGILSRHLKIDEDRILQNLPSVGLNDNGDFDVPALMADVEWYKSHKYLPRRRAFKSEDFIDPSFALEAVNQLAAKGR